MMKTLPCDDWLTLDDDATLLLLFKRCFLAGNFAHSTTMLEHIHTAASRTNSELASASLVQWLIVSAPRLPSLAVFDLLLACEAPLRVGTSQNAVVTLLSKKLTRDDERQTRILLLARWSLRCDWIDEVVVSHMSDVDRDDPTLVEFIGRPQQEWARRVQLPPLRETVLPFILAPRPDSASIAAEWAPLLDSQTMIVSSINPPLHLALERGAPLDVVALLLARGADVNLRRAVDGSPPLHLSQSFECDKLLIAAGANPRLVRLSDGRSLSQARPHDFDVARTWFLQKEAPRINKLVVHTTLLHICIAMAPIFADLAPEVVDRIVMMLPGMRVVDAGARLALIVRIGTAFANKCDGGSVALLPLENDARPSTPVPTDVDETILEPNELKRRVNELMPKLSSRDVSVALPAAVAVRKLLSVAEHAQAVVDCGALPLLVDLLRLDSNEIAFEVLWSLTNLAMDCVPQLLESDALPLVITLAQSTDPNVCLQALWFLCNMGHDSNVCRQALVAARVDLALNVLINVHQNVPLPILQHAAELCSALCGGKDPECLDLMQPLLLVLVNASEDIKVLAEACKGLALIGAWKPSRLIKIGVVPRLVRLLEHLSHDVRLEALVAIGTLASGTAVETDAIATPVVCARLLELFASPIATVVKEAAFVMSNLCAGTIEQKRMVVECGIVEGLIRLVRFADHAVQREAAWSLANLASTTDTGIITSVVDSGATTMMIHYGIDLAEDSDSTTAVVLEFLECVHNDPRFLSILRGVDGAMLWLTLMSERHTIATTLIEFEASNGGAPEQTEQQQE
jgi:importin subunit alpha-1